jgi:hypothetical protein
MIRFIKKIKERILQNKEVKKADNSSVIYYLYKARATKQTSRAC